MKKRHTNFAAIQEWASKQKRAAAKLTYEAGISQTLARGLISGTYHSLPQDHFRENIAKTIGKPEDFVFPYIEEDVA